jgi:hypothetical protein
MKKPPSTFLLLEKLGIRCFMLNNEKTDINQPQLSYINLIGLPQQLQLELIDFYEFLIKKYHVDNESLETQTNFKRFLYNPIQVPQIQSWTRDELHER